MRGIILFMVAFWMGAMVPAWGTAAQAGEPLVLDDLIQTAVAENPEILSFQKQMEVSRAAVPQAGALDDPMVTIGVDNVPISDPSFDAFLPTSKVLGLSQKFPFPGKLSLKESAADAAAGAAEAAYQDKISEITRRVKTAYFDLYFITRSIRINERNRDLLRGLADTAATKYAVGTGLQQDVLKAQVELSKIIDELIVLRQKKETERARINTLLNRLPQSPLGDPPELTPTPFDFSVEALQEMAVAKSYPLQAMKKVIESNEAAVAFAKKQYLPDFNLALTYKQREEGATFQGDDWFSAFVTVNVPLYFKRKQEQGVVQSQAELARAQSRYTEVKNQILFQVKDTYEEIRKEEELIHLFEQGFLPQARQSLDSAISGYQVDKVDFLTLVDNQLTLLKFELGYARTLANYEKKLAEMEGIVDQRLF